MVDEDAGAMGVMVVSHVGSLGLPHLSYGCDDVEDGGRAKAQQPQLHRVPSSTQCKSLHTEEQIANDKISSVCLTMRSHLWGSSFRITLCKARELELALEKVHATWGSTAIGWRACGWAVREDEFSLGEEQHTYHSSNPSSQTITQ
jgi:hypothetical protein